MEFAQGNGNFHTLLRAARQKEFKWVLLVADEDDTPDDRDERFKVVRAQLRKAKYADINGRTQQLPPQDNNPGVEVLMLPWYNEPGCLENCVLASLCGTVSRAIHGLKEFAKCTKSAQWSVSKSAEMMVHCVLGATQVQNPRVGLNNFFGEA